MPGPGVATATTSVETNRFVTKLDPNGSALFAIEALAYPELGAARFRRSGRDGRSSHIVIEEGF